MLEEHLTKQILAAFFPVYRDLGFGFLEPVYSNSFAVELQKRGIPFKREVPLHVLFCGVDVGFYRADFIVDERVLVEVKATQALSDADERQLLNYLKASRIEVGLLLHFGPSPKFRRRVYANERK